MEPIQFFRLILVGRSSDGCGLLGGYRAERRDGPWQFAQTAAVDVGGFLHEPGVRQMSERNDKQLGSGRAIDCVVRSYSGTRETRSAEHIEGEEWTIGSDGPAIRSTVLLTYQFGQENYQNGEDLSYAGEESVKVGARDLIAYRTVEKRFVGAKLLAGNTQRYWSADIPGWLVRRRSWSQDDEKQLPNFDDEVIEFGPDPEMLVRYVKTDRPAEAEEHQTQSQPGAATRSAPTPAR